MSTIDILISAGISIICAVIIVAGIDIVKHIIQ